MKKNVLIVEDEIMIANVIQMHLENAGYNCVGIAVDFNEAIEILNQEKIDIALLDVNISGDKKGTTLANYIHHTYNLPYIFLTAYSDKKTIEEIKSSLPYGYLKKPIEKDNLLVAVELAINNFTQKQLEKIKLKIGKETYFFQANELLYIEADHVYVHLVMQQAKNLLLRISLTNILELIPAHVLKQINRSQAVNPFHIQKISGDKIYINNEIFKISSLYKGNFE